MDEDHKYAEVLSKAHYDTATRDEVLWLWRIIQGKLAEVGAHVQIASNSMPLSSWSDWEYLNRTLSDLSRLQHHTSTLGAWWVRHENDELQEQNHA